MLKIKNVLKYIRFWPPYWAAGIKVTDFSKDLTRITVQMPLIKRNTNYVGTHFGGNLYSMCDPWYMFILMEHLGPNYIVWDKAAEIEFVSPGKGTVSATFHISIDEIENLKKQLDETPKCLPVFHTEVTDMSHQTVAKIRKTLYVKRKDISNK
jgi:acyl-coenzyme A thioesterase PaaI-like protein